MKSYSCFRTFDNTLLLLFQRHKKYWLFSWIPLTQLLAFWSNIYFQNVCWQLKMKLAPGCVLMIESYQGELESQFPPRSEVLAKIPNFTQYGWCKDIFLPGWYFLILFFQTAPFANREYVSFSLVKLQKTLVFRSFCNFQYY